MTLKKRPARRRAQAIAADDQNKFDKRKTEILLAAAATFRGRGFAGSSMSMIAGELGMYKSNLYYYFKTKEEILFECHKYFMHENLTLLETVKASDSSNAEKLTLLISSFVHIMIDKLHGSALTQNVKALSREHEKTVVAWRDTFERGLRTIIRRGVEEGEFRLVDAKLITFAILGAVNWIHRWHNERGDKTSEEIASAFADFHLHGLLATQASPRHTRSKRQVTPFR